MNDCIFCQIIAGESPASIFYEDDTVLGLMSIGPVTTGHAMVIPKQHFAYLGEMDEETGRQLFAVTQRTAAAIRKSGVKCEGIKRILIKDSMCFQIDPSLAEHYPGSGGSASEAAVRFQFEYDALNSTIVDLSIKAFKSLAIRLLKDIRDVFVWGEKSPEEFMFHFYKLSLRYHLLEKKKDKLTLSEILMLVANNNKTNS